MQAITQQWINKAKGDWGSANRDYRARKPPNFVGACYHMQQCAEKYLKTRLQEAVVAPPRTHDLEDLLTLVLPIEPGWSILRLALRRLTTYATAYRYPGRIATKADAHEAIKLG